MLSEQARPRWCGCGDRAMLMVGTTAYCPDCANEVLGGDIHDNIEQILDENAGRTGGSSGAFHNDPALDNAVRALEDSR